MARQAMFAGTFYEKSPTSLTNQIKECFTHEKGPGELPVNKRTKKLKAVIAPHAGYVYSGPCAAWAYKEITESEFADLYIIIGPNHSGNGSFVSVDMWKTPFGEVRVDKEFAKFLLKQNDQLKLNEEAFLKEHAVEVQLPFLQFATQDKMHSLKILPIIVDHELDYKKLALDLKEAVLETNRKVVVIVSSDFTHYGRNYRYLPFSQNVQENIYKLDRQAIDFIQKFDAEGFSEFNYDKITTICGQTAIAVLLSFVRAEKANLDQYYTSADITDGDYKNTVSYAAISFY